MALAGATCSQNTGAPSPHVAVAVSLGRGDVGTSGRHRLLALSRSAQLLAGLVVVTIHETARGSSRFASRECKESNYGQADQFHDGYPLAERKNAICVA